ncbi:HNH endonuclease [uncultured Sphingomonas sp.]|uniref:HNH endonuclease n=1 Tax=uncultured Sphingomonas sp. TaxID=158754 RepID=UPI0026015A52|nr:HNH endonuclease [uncultured Sphingomonas sp.]
MDEDEDSAIIEGTRPLPAHLQKLIDMLPLNVAVHRTEVERLYGNSNYARRIRKIEAEYGWVIERHRGSNGANDDWYTRRSEGPVREARIRREVRPKLRQVVYERDGWRCVMDGADVSPEQMFLKPQCDHKVPAARGGPSTIDNLQTLCTVCNLKKRQACHGCQLPTCVGCPYAFPELFEDRLVLNLDAVTGERLRMMSDVEGVPPAVLVTRLIERARPG